MAEKQEKENIQPKKKCKLSLSLKDRFKKASGSKLEELSKVTFPKNTSQSTRWAMKNFIDWFNEYNRCNPDDKCPEDVILPTCSAEVLNKWLCVYVAETRSCSGEAYPPATVHSLLSGILRHMRSQNPMYPNFLDKSNPNFSAFTTTIDNFYKDLRSGGVGATSKHAEGISREEEELLWTSMVLNVTSTLGLLRAVFFSNGKGFCLRGGQEHRDLKLSQLERLSDPDRYVYHENSSKNKKGGLRELRLEHKSVSVIAVPDVGERCHVSLLDLYISKLPPEAVEQDLFYCRPLEQAPQDSTKPWYSAVPVGRNTLNKMVSSMCAEAGVKGSKTNHSLRVAGASTLFEAGVPEKVIQSRTGHKSVPALRVYERVSSEQEEKVSKILSGSMEKFTDEKESESKSHPIPLQPASNQYNNCTVNMFQMPPTDFYSHTNFPPWMNSIPSYAPTSSSFPPPYSDESCDVPTNQQYPYSANLPFDNGPPVYPPYPPSN